MPAPFSVAAALLLFSTSQANAQARATSLDTKLRTALRDAGFTGTIESELLDRLGVDALDTELIGLGSFLFFDPILSIHEDASCASCHSPAFGWGDSQSIAIGVQNNYVVGADRTGPRNLRRSPMTANTAFYPKLMWDGRFSAPSGDPFDNSLGFEFPAPEGTTAFPANDPHVTHLLEAQAFLPVTELVEMAGFNGLADSELDDVFDQFDEDVGAISPDADLDVPDVDATNYRHEPIRQKVLDRLYDNLVYRNRFTSLFGTLSSGVEYWMVAEALAEFQFNQVAADAPLDQYMRTGDNSLLTDTEKRGALIFFGKGECVSCHAVAGDSNEMFSDFQNHVMGVPQVAPEFGVDKGNVLFDGDGQDEDYGLERTTGLDQDRYMFRTAPLRNLARSPAYFHNGSFTDLEEAIRYHIDVVDSASTYTPPSDLAADLTKLGPVDDMLAHLDPWFDSAPSLTDADIRSLVVFVRDALDDEKLAPGHQCAAKPKSLPSRMPMEEFEGCPSGHGH